MNLVKVLPVDKQLEAAEQIHKAKEQADERLKEFLDNNHNL